ncbi:hypothetical protein [Streptomyces aureoversilis]|uniref:Uncharacterized protein n=1 Tax=Streptomyces aureoversilis TaxID=67277 RepID=A0ABW0A903_9ACTN
MRTPWRTAVFGVAGVLVLLVAHQVALLVPEPAGEGLPVMVDRLFYRAAQCVALGALWVAPALLMATGVRVVVLRSRQGG